MGLERGRIASYFVNSVLITAGTVLLVVVRSALAGYVLGRYDFPGKKLLIGVFLVTFFLPEGYTIIPVTQLTDQLGLLNTHAGVILGLGAGGQIASTLLYAGYFRGLPKELEESAKLDGAGPFRTFFQIMMPMAWPITATVVILTFLFAWNTYLLPLVFTLSEPDLRTLAIGMTVFVGEYGHDWSGMAAAAVISLSRSSCVRHPPAQVVDSIAGAVNSDRHRKDRATDHANRHRHRHRHSTTRGRVTIDTTRPLGTIDDDVYGHFLESASSGTSTAVSSTRGRDCRSASRAC